MDINEHFRNVARQQAEGCAPVSDFSRFSARLAGLCQTASELGSHIHAVADAVYGSPGTGSQTNAKDTAPYGAIGEIEAALDRMEGLLANAMAGVFRLQTLA